MRRMPASATTSASTAPMATRTPASVTKWRTMRARDAPSASRTDSSRRRDSVRTSSRLTTLMQAITSSSAAPPSSSHSVGRMSPTMTSASGPTNAPWSRFESGYWRSSCRAITAIAAPRFGDGHARLEAPDAVQAVAAAARPGSRRWRRSASRTRRLRSGANWNVARQHADDGVAGAAQRDAAADHRPIAAEALLPGPMRDDRDLGALAAGSRRR